MIPKVIHYIWFGGRKPRIFKQCLRSWKKYCQDYEIKEWGADNLPIGSDIFTSDCFAHKKYAYLSDYFRLWVIYHYGGIYLDIDVELCKSLDSLCSFDFFIGRDEDGRANTGQGFGAIPNNQLVLSMLKEYQGRPLIRNQAGQICEETCCFYNNKVMLAHGFSETNRTEVIARSLYLAGPVMDPIMYIKRGENVNRAEVISIHHHLGSWIGIDSRIKYKRMRHERLTVKEKLYSIYKSIWGKIHR